MFLFRCTIPPCAAHLCVQVVRLKSALQRAKLMLHLASRDVLFMQHITLRRSVCMVWAAMRMCVTSRHGVASRVHQRHRPHMRSILLQARNSMQAAVVGVRLVGQHKQGTAQLASLEGN